MHWPYLSLSLVVHAALLATLYYFGSYQPQLREQGEQVASSLRATREASTVKRLQDLQTIKELLGKSADRVDSHAEPDTAPFEEPRTPGEMLERARELSRSIDELDEKIRADELSELLGMSEPRPMPEPPTVESVAVPQAPNEETPTGNEGDPPEPVDAPAPVTQEMAAREVAALEAKARETLIRRQQRLEARANGVPVEGLESAPGESGSSAATAASAGAGQGSGTVGAEIADFIGATGSIDPKVLSTTYSNMRFFGQGSGQIPPVDTDDLVLGRGRMFGAGGEYANRVYLNTWYIIGPFAGRHGAGLFENPAYPPEQAVLLDAVYHGKGNRLLRWRYVIAQSYPLVPPDSVEDAVYYGYTEVFVDEDCDLTAWIGVDDDVQIYLNDRLVWRGGNIDKQWYFNAVFSPGSRHLVRDYNRTEARRVLHFNKGRNKIFFKLSNGPNHSFLSFVLTR
jgi:hypothetical protein